jgi:hypothetical protein
MAEYKRLTKIEKRFCQIVRDWAEDQKKIGVKYKQQADRLGLTESQYSNIRAYRKPLNEDDRRRILELIGFDYSKIIENQNPSPHPSTLPEYNPAPQVQHPKVKHMRGDRGPPVRHEDLIKLFIDPDTGCHINRMLIDIEAADPDKYKHLKEYIEYVHSGIAAKKKETPANGL